MANNKKIGERIKQVREEKGLTLEELAKQLGLNKSTIQRYESAKIEKIKLPIIEAIAQQLDVNPEWLSDKTEIRTSYTIPVSENVESIQQIGSGNITDRVIDVSLITHTDTVPIPRIGQVAAGINCYAEDNIEEYIPTDRDILKEGYQYFWLSVIGDSMEPELKENDLVLVREQKALERECYAVVRIDDEDGVVKRVKVEADKITLTSVNPYYPPREFCKEDMNRISIVGPVLEVKRRFNP